MADILLSVFEHLMFDAMTLSRAMRVNSLWASTASHFLWMTVQERQLLTIRDRRRQQYYADRIRMLIALPEPAPQKSAFEGVQFPRLRTLSLLSVLPTSCFQRYLVPTLTELQCSGHLPMELGRQLSERCPHLRHFMYGISAPFGDAASAEGQLAALLAFFQRCMLPLPAVTLSCIWLDCAESRAVFEHLAHRAKLVELSCSAIDSCANVFVAGMLPREQRAQHDTATAAASAAVARFADLRSLRMRMSAPQTEGLSRSAAAACLASLRVHVTDNDCARLFAALASLSALAALRLCFVVDGIRLADNDFGALRQLRRLRSLALTGATLSTARTLTDAGFSATLQCLPHLECLQLAFAQGALGLSGAALRAVGESCRKLERLDMCGAWDLSCWRDAGITPLFPQLLFFQVDEAIMKKEGMANDK